MRTERKSHTRQSVQLFKPGQQLTDMELRLEQYIRALPKREQKPARVYLVYLRPELVKIVRSSDEEPTRDEMARCGLICLKDLAGKPFWERIVNGYHASEAKKEQDAFTTTRSNV